MRSCVDYKTGKSVVKRKGSGEGQKRRVRTPWLDYEIQNLIIGVYNFGVGKWAIIHNQMSFQKNRTYIDLKDKWRNLIDHRPCSRTSSVYRAVASIIQKRQKNMEHVSPKHLLGRNDWQTMVNMFYSNIQDEIENNTPKPIVYEIPPINEDIPTKNIQVMPPKVEMAGFQIAPINKTLPPTIIQQSIQAVPIIRHKLPSLQDFLW